LIKIKEIKLAKHNPRRAKVHHHGHHRIADIGILERMHNIVMECSCILYSCIQGIIMVKLCQIWIKIKPYPS